MNDFQTIFAEGITDDHVLSSVLEIEDVLLIVNEINSKVAFYKDLKARRVQSIDAELSTLSQKEAMLRKIILNTMEKVAPKDKTLNFPSIGKVSRRKTAETYQVVDEKQVIAFLSQKGVRDEIVKTEEVIDRRKLKTYVKQFKETGEVVPGVDSTPGRDSLSITFEKPKHTETSDSSPVQKEVDLECLDALVV